jgi:phosphomannomutase / phosphoglucomutase
MKEELKMKDTIFRKYDIRGVVGKDLLVDQCYELGKAIITYIKQKDENFKKILVGRDGRIHSEPIRNEIVNSFLDLGIDVIDIGIVPTPVLYFAVNTLNIAQGIIITASHNPKEYNGMKMWGISGQNIQDIKEIFYNKNFTTNSSNKEGQLSHYNAKKYYIDYMANHFKHLKNKNINAIIDCGNGAAGTIMSDLVESMGWKNVKLLYEKVDGSFPNHEADPTVPANMHDLKKLLLTSKRHSVGVGFDGDCDRMSPMTHDGYLVPGDQLLALYAKKIVQNNPGCPVVFDIKASSSLVESLKKMGANPIFSPSGHSLIKKALHKYNALLAGELSCHFFFKDRYFGFDDAFYAALRLFEIIEETGKDLTTLIADYPKKHRTPEIRIPCSSDSIKGTIIDHVKKTFINRKDAKLVTIDGIRAHTNYGWGLARASNTQPVICLRFESETKEGIETIKKDFSIALEKFFDKKKLIKLLRLN